MPLCMLAGLTVGRRLYLILFLVYSFLRKLNKNNNTCLKNDINFMTLLEGKDSAYQVAVQLNLWSIR